MRFSAIHKAASYLMVASAFAALALSRELHPLLVALTAAVGALSYFFEPTRHPLLRTRGFGLAWNLATLAMFSWTLLDALRGEPLDAGVRFLCFLLVNKLWNRRASRDYLQAYVISFLMLVAGAALSSDLAYAGCFLAYVVFATWTLTLFHLRREMEENYLLKHADGAQSERVEVERILNSRRIVGGAFLAGTSVVSVGIFVGATLVFFLIPRFGFGFFATQKRRGVTTVGFSDRVELGEYGLVKDNPQVVMRVELPGGPPTMSLRLRGVTFDRYLHGRWSRTQGASEALRRYNEMSLPDTTRKTKVVEAELKARLAGALEQRVYLDPLDTPTVFGAHQMIALELPRNTTGAMARIDFEGRGAGDVIAVERHVEAGSGKSYSVERKSGLRYTVYSDLKVPPVAQLLALPDPEAQRPELASYLMLPRDLPPRIAELANKVAAGHKGPYAKAHALEAWLATSYRYTLDLKRDERYEPLDDFLFVQKAGHCEYFASAMAVMLRAVGIPSRSVNGFLGGEWNSYGNYLAIRQGDAHSWVEAYIEGAGWLTFDPTPSGPASPPTNSVWQTLRQVLDTAELAWFKYVIEYDLSKQADAVSSMRRWASQATGDSHWWSSLLRHKKGIAIAVLLGGAVVLLLRRRNRPAGPRRSAKGQVAHHAFARALKALERRGFLRAESETGRELAVRLAEAGDPAAEPFADLVELYYGARFGDSTVAPAVLELLAERVARPPTRIDPPHAPI